MEQHEYEKDLKRRQEEHLAKVNASKYNNPFWQPCAHEQCSECVGTGLKLDGGICVHHLYCSCPKCTPQYISTIPFTFTGDIQINDFPNINSKFN